MESGAASFESLERGNLGGAARTFTLLVLAVLLAFMGLLARENTSQLMATGLFAVSGLLGLYTVSKILGGLNRLWINQFRRPAPVLLFNGGVEQKSAEGGTNHLEWQDIRVIQHRRRAHLIRGKDKDSQVEISLRLRDHDDLAAFIEFAFLLRQEAGKEWEGLLYEVRDRLDDKGFHFHFDRNRAHAIHIDRQGITHTASDGTVEQMDWALMKESIFDRGRTVLRFRHPGTKTSLSIPLGGNADQIIDQFIRWALHSDPSFS
jgi:hypothetical protein